MLRTHTVATRETLSKLAEKMIQRYIRDLLTVDELVELITLAWPTDESESMPGESTLESLARGLCSQALCEACRLPGGHRRDLAIERLSEYLERALGDIGGTFRHADREVRQEMIQCTLVEILQSLQREGGKPEQPMAFLGWVRVILYRQRSLYWRLQKSPVELIPLEKDQDESQLLELVDMDAPDPQTEMERHELRTELHAAIARLRNPNYRAVLLQIYFNELEACEVAHLLQVPAEKIHLWHHRALHALHKQFAGTPAQRRF